MGAADAAPGVQVRVKLGEPDEIALDVRGTVLEVLRGDAAPLPDDDNGEEEDAGPLAIAVDVNEAPSEEGAAANTDNPAL